MSIHRHVIGCDVSKRRLDFFDAGHDASLRIVDTADAIAAFVDELADRSVFIVFEATGSHDSRLRRSGNQIVEMGSCALPPTMIDGARYAG